MYSTDGQLLQDGVFPVVVVEFVMLQAALVRSVTSLPEYPAIYVR